MKGGQAMAKPLGPKSTLIREAIQAHPRAGNKKLAETINGSDARKDDGIEVTAADVALQRKLLKKAGVKAKRSGNGVGQKGGKRGGAAANGKAPSATPAPAPVGVVELIDEVFSLAHKCGGLLGLKRLVDRLAEAQGR
jgi:hypothetical protein